MNPEAITPEATPIQRENIGVLSGHNGLELRDAFQDFDPSQLDEEALESLNGLFTARKKEWKAVVKLGSVDMYQAQHNKGVYALQLIQKGVPERLIIAMLTLNEEELPDFADKLATSELSKTESQ